MTYSRGLVSFCCLSYNHEKYIKKCIESIWSQHYKNIEIIVLDDGSTDQSLEVIKGCKVSSPCSFKIISQKNSGGLVGSNFNKLISESCGEYLFFISTDDEVIVDAITSKIDILNSCEKVSFIANSRINLIDNNSKIKKHDIKFSWESDYDITNINSLINAEYDCVGTFFIQGGVFRHCIIDIIGGFDDDLLGDDIILRTKLFLYLSSHTELTYRILTKASVNYRIHSSNIHKNIIRQNILKYEWYNRYFSYREPSYYLMDNARCALLLDLNDYLSNSDSKEKNIDLSLKILKYYASKFTCADYFINDLLNCNKKKSYTIVPVMLKVYALKNILNGYIEIHLKIFNIDILIAKFKGNH